MYQSVCYLESPLYMTVIIYLTKLDTPLDEVEYTLNQDIHLTNLDTHILMTTTDMSIYTCIIIPLQVCQDQVPLPDLSLPDGAVSLCLPADSGGTVHLPSDVRAGRSRTLPGEGEYLTLPPVRPG